MKKILILYNSALGDFITFLSFLKLLKYNYRNSKIEIFTRSTFAPLLKDYNVSFRDIDNIKWYLLFKNKPRVSSYFYFLKEFDKIISFFGVSNRIFQENLLKYNQNTYFIFPHNKFQNTHQILYLINSYPFKIKKVFYPEIKIDNKEKEYFIIHPGSGSKNKNYSIEFFAELSNKIEKYFNLKTLWIGGYNELGLSNKIYIVKDLKELLKIFESSFFYIGNDSGVSHLSAATGILTFSFFKTTSPFIWAPIGNKSVILTEHFKNIWDIVRKKIEQELNPALS